MYLVPSTWYHLLVTKYFAWHVYSICTKCTIFLLCHVRTEYFCRPRSPAIAPNRPMLKNCRLTITNELMASDRRRKPLALGPPAEGPAASRRGATAAAVGPGAARRGAQGARTARATASAAEWPGGGRGGRGGGRRGEMLSSKFYSSINRKRK